VEIERSHSWQRSGTDRIQFLKNSPEIFFRFEDAEGAGVEYAKNWVDNKVNKSNIGDNGPQKFWSLGVVTKKYLVRGFVDTSEK
jgi:hypothetical protein